MQILDASKVIYTILIKKKTIEIFWYNQFIYNQFTGSISNLIFYYLYINANQFPYNSIVLYKFMKWFTAPQKPSLQTNAINTNY